MSRSSFTATLVALSLVCWPIPAIAMQPPRDKQREDLMDQLGVPKKKPKPPAEPPSEPAPPSDPDPSKDPAAPSDPDSPGTPPSPGDGSTAPTTSTPSITFSNRIRKQLTADCESCHASAAMAGTTRYVITGELDADYRVAKQLVSTTQPKSSLLLRKASGDGHGGGSSYPVGSAKYKTLLQWIESGAPKGSSGGAKPAPTPTPTPTPAPEDKPKPKAKPKPGFEHAPEISEPESDVELPDLTEPPPPPSMDGAPLTAYNPTIAQILRDRCESCHAPDAFAGKGSFGLHGDPTYDYETVLALVDLGNPDASALLVKARGEGHGGGATLTVDSDDYRELLAWIEAGAPGPTADTAIAPESQPQYEVDATTRASPDSRLGDGTPVPEASSPNRLPFSLPYALRLNGRFDLSYERRDYKNQPFGPGRNALQTYHHFLFLSRSGAADPFGFNIEILTQQFFEFNARFVTRNERAKFLIKAGKIMVPFGDEPLYHSSYGGKTGFDQELLPAIWSQPGLALNANVTLGPVSLASDTYAVQGYGLRAADGVLDLRSDVSSIEDLKFGVGERLGLSIAPLTVWYSLQVNPLGFNRTLLMQAVDVEFWRLQGVPVLEDLVVGLGGMRSDVSGGGAGNDYYHFGSYGMIRYYPVDWLHVQYRWGLKTFDNRRGFYYDDTRADERDNSSHNLTIGATYKGFYTALQLFWNLEKANEQDNDFMRLTVGYAF
jgi:mono/diheme cytochrome c family protein